MNQRTFTALLLLFSFTFLGYGQTESPYETSWTKDGIWVGTGLGLNVLGLKLIQDKEPLTDNQLRSLSKEDIPAIDRWAAGNYSEDLDQLSYYPFYGSFAVPFVMMLADNEMRPHAGQITVLFVETMATTGALFTITAGAIDRERPLVYNENLSDDERRQAKHRRSFFAGHTAATASASFFAAKVFHDFHPDSPWRPVVWTAAAAVPAWVAYLRLESGKHFLTDNLVGYGIGAAVGILVPELHKKKKENLDLYPAMGVDYQGVGMTYRF